MSPAPVPHTPPNDVSNIQLKQLVGTDELLEDFRTEQTMIQGAPETLKMETCPDEPGTRQEMLSPQGSSQRNSLGCGRGEQRTASSKASSSLYSFQQGGAGARRGSTTNNVPAQGYAMSGGGVGGVTYGGGMGGPPSCAGYGAAGVPPTSQGYGRRERGYVVPQTTHRDNADAMQASCLNPSAQPYQFNVVRQGRGGEGAQVGPPRLARGYQHRSLRTADQLSGTASGRGGRLAADHGQ